MIKIRKKLGKCVAMLLALIMVLTAPMTHMTVKADNAGEITINGVHGYTLFGDISANGGHWGIWLKVDGQWALEKDKGCSASSEPLSIRDKEGNLLSRQAYSSFGVQRADDYLFIDVWGEYTKNHAPQTGDRILIPTLTITDPNNVSQKIAKRAVIEFDGTNWNVVEDTINIKSVYAHSADSGQGWRFYFDVKGEWVSTDNVTYNKDDSYKVTINKASGTIGEVPAGNLEIFKSGERLFMVIWGQYTEVKPEVGDQIIIPAVKLSNSTDASQVENFSETTVIKYDGSNWNLDTEAMDAYKYTKLDIKGFCNYQQNSCKPDADGNYAVYLNTNNELPGKSWGVDFKIKALINEQEYTLETKKADAAKVLYLNINSSHIPYGNDGKVTLKAGKYGDGKGNDIKLDQDWTFYISKYGMSTSDKILDKNVVKGVKFTLGTTTADGVYLSTNKNDGLLSDAANWSRRSKPAINRYSSDNTMYYWNNNSKYGLQKDGEFVGLDYLKEAEYNNYYRLIAKIGDNSHYLALSDLWGSGKVTDGTYTVTGVFCDDEGNLAEYEELKLNRTTDENGNVKYEEILDIDYTQFTLSEIYKESKYQDEPKRYDTYIKPSADFSAIPDDTQFTGLKLKVGDGEEINISVFKAGHMNSFFFMADENIIPKNVAKGTKITIKKGKAISSDKTLGIELTEDYVMYALGNAEGFTTERPIDYTTFNVTAFKHYTKFNSTTNTWQFYVGTDANLPGTEWNEKVNIKVMVGNKEIEATAQKYSNSMQNVMFFEIPASDMPKDQDTTVTILKGQYACNDANINLGYNIASDFKFYASKHGCSVNDKILDKNVIKAGFVLGTTLNEVAAVRLQPTIDDGLTPDYSGWSVRLKAATNIDHYIDTDAVYFNNGNGVSIDGTYHNGELPLVKLQEYYVAFGDIGVTPETGKEYTIGGVFYSNQDGQLFEFAPITVKWDGSTWSKVSKSLADTGVESDVNGDGEADVRDLIRLVHYHRTDKNPDVNEARLDVNKDGDFVKNANSADILSLRKILAGYVAYITPEGGASATPSGTPSYSKKNKVEVMAYSCPSSGTWSSEDVETRTFTPSPTLDADLKAYKDAGFTLLLSEFVGVLKNNELNETKQADLVAYLKAAQRQGLGVIVCSDYINALLMEVNPEGINFDKKIQGTDVLEWKSVLSQYVTWLKKYPAFRGFMMADELKVQKAENYKKVCEYLKSLKPDIYLHSSQLPVSAYETSGFTPADLTTDPTTNNTKELAYKDYVKHFGLVNDHYTFDLYSLIYSEGFLGTGSAYSVNAEWYDNLKWTTDVIKESRYAFTLGVTIQSCKIAGTDSIWSKYERYAPEQKSDIGFQVYTAMAYGAKEINYFSYLDHPTDTSVQQEIQLNDKVRAAVTAVNEEVASFGYVFKSFNWKDTLDIAKGGSNTSTGNARLASVSATGGRTFVGCMKDVDGFDGYMVANAEGPRTSNNATVTMKFNNASSVTVYKGTTSSKVNITGGVYTLNLNVGEGAFVIPNYN